MTGLPPLADRRDDRRHGARPAPDVGGMQSFQLRVVLLPAAILAALGVTVTAFLLAGGASDATTRAVLAIAAAAALLVLGLAAAGAGAATRRVQRQLDVLRSVSARGERELQLLTERVRRGERPVTHAPDPVHARDTDPFERLAHDLERERHAAELAVLQVASLTPRGEADERVEVFVNLARRMQSLVHREIQLLDDLEAQVEDPDLLKGLFTVDHLATRMRRQSESLAVLGGAVSRRQWSRPVTMHEVLRASVAEVEQYSRVKVVPPVEGVLKGNAVADIIHLIAELIENATKFSAPHTQTLLRAQLVTAGLAVEVEDRGLGMLPADRQRMNALLADPSRVNISELLQDGRIGLFVVSSLARRHGVKVLLQNNIFGGTQAVVVLPKALVGGGPHEPGFQEVAQETQPTGVAYPDPERLDAGSPQPGAVGPGRPAQPEPLAPAGPPQPEPLAPARVQPEPIPATAFAGPAGEAPPAPPAAAAPGGADGAGAGGRPPLPKRAVQASLAPQLRDAPASRRDQPAPDQIPGLMAAFQRGVSRAEGEE